MRLRRWHSILLLFLSSLACQRAGDPKSGSAPARKAGAAGNSRDARATLPLAGHPAGGEGTKAAPIDEPIRPVPDRDLVGVLTPTIEAKAAEVFGEALLLYRHFLDFSNAVAAASLALYCECDPETALKKYSPNAEARDQIRVSVNAICGAMKGEKQLFVGVGASKAIPLAVVPMIRGLDGKDGESAPPLYQLYQVPCHEAGTEKDEVHQVIPVTIIWDGLPKRKAAVNRFEATVSIPFLVFPRRPKAGENLSQTPRVESRTFRFALQDGKWIKD